MRGGIQGHKIGCYFATGRDYRSTSYHSALIATTTLCTTDPVTRPRGKAARTVVLGTHFSNVAPTDASISLPFRELCNLSVYIFVAAYWPPEVPYTSRESRAVIFPAIIVRTDAVRTSHLSYHMRSCKDLFKSAILVCLLDEYSEIGDLR